MRKTIDSFELHVNYGQGWEHETTNWTVWHAIEERNLYRQNCPQYPTKIVKRRVSRSTLDATDMKEIDAQAKAAHEKRMSLRTLV